MRRDSCVLQSSVSQLLSVPPEAAAKYTLAPCPPTVDKVDKVVSGLKERLSGLSSVPLPPAVEALVGAWHTLKAPATCLHSPTPPTQPCALPLQSP